MMTLRTVLHFGSSVRILIPQLLLVAGLFSQSAYGVPPVFATFDFSTGTNASLWKITGAGAVQSQAVNIVGTSNISFSSNGNQSGNFISGASAAAFDGVWKAEYSFLVPDRQTVFVELMFSGLNADDRAVLVVNDNKITGRIGQIAFGGKSGWGWMGYDTEVVDTSNLTAVYFDGSSGASGKRTQALSSASGLFKRGEVNKLTLWVNNNPTYPVGGTSTDGRPLPLQGVWDGTTAGLTGSITFRDYQIRAFPDPGEITPNPAGNAIVVPYESQSYFNAVEFKNEGVIRISGRLQNLPGATLSGIGQGQLLVDSGASARFTNDGSLEIGQMALIQNSGEITSNGSIFNDGEIWNDGKFYNRAGATLVHASTGSFVNFEGRRIENYGSFVVAEFATFENRGTVQNSKTMELLGGDNLSNGVPAFRNSSAGSVLFNGGTLSVDFGTLSNAGTITNYRSLAVERDGKLSNESGATLTNFGDLKITGVLRNYGTLIHNKQLAITAGGRLEILGGSVHSSVDSIVSNARDVVLSGNWLSDGTMINELSGEFVIEPVSYMDISGSSVFENFGLFKVSGGGDVVGSGTFANMAGKIINNGTFSVETLEMYPSSELSGSGVFTSHLVACPAPGCTVRPGQSPGTMTFTGDLVLGAGSVLEFEVAAGAQDEIIVLGNAEISADAQIIFLNDYRPASGTAFSFLNVSGTKSVNLGSITVSGLPVGYAWDAATLASTGQFIITAVPVPEPRIYLLMLLGIGALALGRRSAAVEC